MDWDLKKDLIAFAMSLFLLVYSKLIFIGKLYSSSNLGLDRINLSFDLICQHILLLWR